MTLLCSVYVAARYSWPEVRITRKIYTSGRKFDGLCPGGGGTPLYDLNGDVRPDRVWFSGCFVLNGVSISSLSVLNRVSLHDLMA